MKIINVDNFDRETVGGGDKLIAENVQSGPAGRCMVDALNKQFSGGNSPNFYQLVEDDYELRSYEP